MVTLREYIDYTVLHNQIMVVLSVYFKISEFTPFQVEYEHLDVRDRYTLCNMLRRNVSARAQDRSNWSNNNQFL